MSEFNRRVGRVMSRMSGGQTQEEASEAEQVWFEVGSDGREEVVYVLSRELKRPDGNWAFATLSQFGSREELLVALGGMDSTADLWVDELDPHGQDVNNILLHARVADYLEWFDSEED